jgi:hypothetical protein
MHQSMRRQQGHPIITSFEPGEEWFFDYEKRGIIKGVELLPPHAHRENQPTPDRELPLSSRERNPLNANLPVQCLRIEEPKRRDHLDVTWTARAYLP